jgi:hypothetical protein
MQPRDDRAPQAASVSGLVTLDATEKNDRGEEESEAAGEAQHEEAHAGG